MVDERTCARDGRKGGTRSTGGRGTPRPGDKRVGNEKLSRPTGREKRGYNGGGGGRRKGARRATRPPDWVNGRVERESTRRGI